MGAWDKIKNILTISDDDEDDVYSDDYDDEEEVYRKPPKREKAEPSIQDTPKESNFGSSFKTRPAHENTKGGQVVDIHTTAKLQVVLTRPESYDERRAIADNLNLKRTVVLNLESVNRDDGRRLIDFLSGVAYANDGQLKRIANCTFIITPYNVDVMGDLIDELESNGVFFHKPH